MLKEINAAIAATATTVAVAAGALEEGSKILKIKGIAAKNLAAIEAVKSIEQSKKDCSNAELEAAQQLLNLVE